MKSNLLSNYFVTSYRRLLKDKVFAVVNILGMALGMCAAILAAEYTSYERSFDDFHLESESIYRVTTEWNPHLTNDDKRATTMPWSGPNVKEAFSEVVDYARVTPLSTLSGINSVSNETQTFTEDNVFVADAGFFKIFSFELLSGDINTALSEPHHIIITESIAKKYFRDKDPLGQNLFMNADNHTGGNFKIAGIIRDPPKNSHLQFDFLLSYTAIPRSLSDGSTYWHWDPTYCYLKVRPDTDIHALEQKMSKLRVDQFGKDFHIWNDRVDFKLQQIGDIHLNPSLRGDVSQHADGRVVQWLSIIGLCILASAYINYFNMSTVSLLERRKEIGVRKAVGSSRTQLVLQFTTESFLINLIALTVAIGLSSLSKPMLEHIFDVPWPAITAASLWNTTGYAMIMLFAGVVLSSLYPSLVLSGIRPRDMLTRSSSFVKITNKRWSIRHVLTIAQFIFCFGFITGTIILYTQLQFMRTHDLGMNLESVVAIRGFGFQPYSEYQNFKQRLKSSPAVSHIGWSTATPGDEVVMLGLKPRAKIEGETDSVELKMVSIDEDFLKTLDIKLLAGRSFDPGIKTDEDAAIINAAAARAFGFDDPHDILGKSVKGIQSSPVKVIGVTRDHHQRSLKDHVEPFVYVPSWKTDLGWNKRYYFIKLDGNFLAENGLDKTLMELQSAWKQSSPQHPFHYFFIDSKFEQQYKFDVAFGKLFLFFSGFAIFIACLGLFGLISFITIQRTKEIGIRKIVGATAGNILMLLTSEFAKLMIVAAIVAIPCSWYLFGQWLETYAYRIPIGVTVTVGPVLLISLASILTVMFRSYRVAVASPIESIRHE
jgi:putative ABC transport system permease protein